MPRQAPHAVLGVDLAELAGPAGVALGEGEVQEVLVATVHREVLAVLAQQHQADVDRLEDRVREGPGVVQLLHRVLELLGTPGRDLGPLRAVVSSAHATPPMSEATSGSTTDRDRLTTVEAEVDAAPGYRSARGTRPPRPPRRGGRTARPARRRGRRPGCPRRWPPG